MTRLTDDRVLQAIDALGGRTHVPCLIEFLNNGRWYANSTLMSVLFGANIGSVYVALARLEKHGKVTSEWGEVVYPERGNRRRRYYSVIRETV